MVISRPAFGFVTPDDVPDGLRDSISIFRSIDRVVAKDHLLEADRRVPSASQMVSQLDR